MRGDEPPDIKNTRSEEYRDLLKRLVKTKSQTKDGPRPYKFQAQSRGILIHNFYTLSKPVTICQTHSCLK